VRLQIVAHRGASESRAEHTLAAYLLALEEGADALECDVRLTRDGHLVCVHDRRLERVSTGRGLVSERTLAELAELDFGAWHSAWPESADDLIRQRVAVPSAAPEERGLLPFDRLLSLVVDSTPPVTLFVETKHPVRYAGQVEFALVKALRRHGLAVPPNKDASRVVMMSFSSLAVRRVRLAAPLLPTVLLIDRLPPPMRTGWLPAWADIAGPGIHMLRADPGYVGRALERGHPTYCWTVDAPADVRLCAKAGVRWMATNRPAAARRALRAL
jgi:glycerophosphoryl diester phosphodiesterase